MMVDGDRRATPAYGNEPSSGGSGNVPVLPLVPAQSSPQHVIIAYRLHLDVVLAGYHLLTVADGNPPELCKQYVLVDMAGLGPPGDPSHRHYRSELLSYNKLVADNASKSQTRWNIEMAARTRLFAGIVQSCMTNAVPLADELRQICDMKHAGLDGGYFDGPRAYQGVLIYLTNEGGRQDRDKLFYDAALEVQLKNSLNDHCTDAEYEKCTRAFIEYICKNLSRPFTEEDSCRHVIRLMPQGLRRIHELTLQDQFVVSLLAEQP